MTVAGGCDAQQFWISEVSALRDTAVESTLVRALTAAPDLDGWTVVERLLEDLASLQDQIWLLVDDLHELRSALMTRDLWVYGIALLGGYGAHFTTSQLFSQYVTADQHFDPSAGGLLSALILLAGIPGSVLGGNLADRSTNLRMFVVGPLITLAALLALIPVAPSILLWPLGIGIGFFLIFGFAAWLAVPSRASNIRAEHIGSATGLMLTLAAIGGFFIPVIFGHLVPHTSYGALSDGPSDNVRRSVNEQWPRTAVIPPAPGQRSVPA